MPKEWGASGRQWLPAFLCPLQGLSLLRASPCHFLKGGIRGQV